MRESAIIERHNHWSSTRKTCVLAVGSYTGLNHGLSFYLQLPTFLRIHHFYIIFYLIPTSITCKRQISGAGNSAAAVSLLSHPWTTPFPPIPILLLGLTRHQVFISSADTPVMILTIDVILQHSSSSSTRKPGT